MQKTSSFSISSPVGGLNDRDSLSNMPSTDAVILDNWFPYPSEIGIRKGSLTWVSSFPGPVETIVEYSPQNGNAKIFAASGGNIYDVTSSGKLSFPVVSDLVSNKWQEVSITTPGGSFLYLFNGVDKPLIFDGETWKSVDEVSTPSIVGVKTSTLVQASLFKNRIWMTQIDSMKVWYLDVNSIAGKAHSFDLGGIFRKGGFVNSIQNWSIDAGEGIDDHLVIISSNGEFAIYSGTDPSTAENFRLVGVFTIGKPIGRRCSTKYGGDLLVMTDEGLYPLSKGLMSSSVDRRVSVTEKIQNGISSSVRMYHENFGWSLVLFTQMNMLILNVPGNKGNSYQYVQNTITGSWAKFTGWKAVSFLNSSLGLFFGDKNSVKMSWVGTTDDENQIVSDCLSSFQKFGNSSGNKYFTMLRPYFSTNGKPSIFYGINTDYYIKNVSISFDYEPPSYGMIWGEMKWGEMKWGENIRNLSSWKSIGKVAQSAGVRIKIQNNGSDVFWKASDILFQRGGIL